MHHNAFFKCVLLLLFSFVQNIVAQDSSATYQSDEEIIVIANKIPTAFSDIARSVVLINQEEIENSPAQSVPELLENVLGVDVQQRGSQGIQADISLRGASFNQTLILLNGLKLSDPQTGHHNMNLPVDISDIERIEVLKGPGSRLYGPNAFGGVINIITKEEYKMGLSIGGLFGEYNLYNSYINFNMPVKNSTHRFSLSKTGSDGYKYNTDLQAFTFSHNSLINLESLKLKFSSGYNEKHFGANNFYIPSFPNPEQYEETKSTYFRGGLDYKLKNISVSQHVYFRKHNDIYFWNKFISLPNIHESNTIGSESSAQLNSSYGITSFGFEFINEVLESNSLGIAGTENSSGRFEHERNTIGLFLQQQIFIQNFSFSIGASLYKYSTEDWHGWPGIDISYKINSNSKIYSSYSEGFRIPTYTNLYLNFPATASPFVRAFGNPNLKNETSQNLELGYAFQNQGIYSELTLFQRNDNNLIDYVFNRDSYSAENISKLITRGIETNLRVINPLKGVNTFYVQYSFLDHQVNLFGKQTLYTLTHFRHQFITGFTWLLPNLENVTNTWKLRYEDRFNNSSQVVLDTRYTLRNKHSRIFLDVTNILNEKYDDIPGVAVPGRWVKLGFEFYLSK